MNPASPGVRRGFWLVGAAILADRLCKALALSGLEAGSAPLQFDLFRNEGIAFSLPVSGPVVWILSLAIIGWAAWTLRKDRVAGRFDRLAPLSLFIFGAASNLFDRVVYGFTVDYLIFFQRSAVNIADGMILAGAFWLILTAHPSTNNSSHKETYDARS